eukprot:TRINITY_DN11540_c0_g1_i1.p1 TRINITY_DN11540_c0_g1~~TRINITY_DN11540_c0_g1_i1.p1  ORF type:complete len:1300 (+),score=561.51 TRINITY_DN11540_c0_g1_i1:54-3902(+)
MRSLLLMLVISACITTGSEQVQDESVVNKLLEGLVIKIPDKKAGKYELKNIELSDFAVYEFNLTERMLDARRGVVGVNASFAFMLEMDIKHTLLDIRVQITFLNIGPLEVEMVLSNPWEPITTGDAVDANITSLNATLGEYKCKLVWEKIFPAKWVCDDIVKEGVKYFVEHKTEIMETVSTSISSYLMALAANTTSHVVPDPWEVAAVLEEPYEGSPDYISFKNNSVFKAAEFVVNDIYGAVDASGNTALGQAISYYTLSPFDFDITIYNKGGNSVVLKKVLLRDVVISRLYLEPVEDHSMMLSLVMSNASIEAIANVTLTNVIHTYTYNQMVNTTLENVDLTFNVSFMIAANGTMYGELPLGSLPALPDVFDMRSLAAWSTKAIECWVQYPIHGSNVSTLNIQLLGYDLETDLISPALSTDISNLLKIPINFFPNALNAYIHAGLNDTLLTINELMHIFPHLEGPNPCAVGASPTPPPVSSFNFSSSKIIKAVDFFVNDVVGTTGSWGINGWLHAVFSRLNLTRHILIHAPHYIGNITFDIDDVHYVGHPAVTDMSLVTPNGTSMLDSDITVAGMNLSMRLYIAISGADEHDFYDNFTLSISADSFTFQDVLDIVINPERLLNGPINGFSVPGCMKAVLDNFGSPYTLALIDNFGVGLQCIDCQSPQFYEAQDTLHNPVGVQQMNNGVQWLLDQINIIFNKNVTKQWIEDRLKVSRIQCDDDITPSPPEHDDSTDGPMTNTKAYLTIFLFAGGIFVILMVWTPLKYQQRKREVFVESGEILMSKPEHMPLILHPSLPAWLRWGVLVILVGTVALFLTSNTPPQGVGAVVRARLWLGGSLIKINNLFTYALANTIRDMWNGAVYPLSILVLLFSGMWPYTKMAVLIWAWVVPPSVCSPKTRGRILQVVDFAGKWSLIDSFMVIMMMVAFRMHILLPPEQQYLPPKFLVLDVIVTPYWGLFGFMTAAILALIINHIMVMANRHCIDYDESGGKSGGWFADASPAMASERMKLALHCDDEEDQSRMWWRSFSVVGLLVLALGLLLAGVSINIFTFEIKGLAAWALNFQGPGTSNSEYSIINLATGVMEQASINDLFAEYLYLVIAFMMFTVVLPIVQILALLGMWLLPLTLKEQKVMFVANEVIAAWCGLEVFIVVLIAVLMEIGKFADFLIGDSCQPIDAAMTNILQPLGYFTHYDNTCFTVKAKLVEGCWILFAAAIASNAAYLVAWNYAEHLIDARHASQVANCPLRKQLLCNVDSVEEGDADVSASLNGDTINGKVECAE